MRWIATIFGAARTYIGQLAFGASLALVVTCAAAPGQALTISGSGDSVALTSADVGGAFNVSWSIDPAEYSQNLTAISSWQIIGFTSTTLTLGISITNTTVLGGLLLQAAVTTFGFGTVPDSTASLSDPGDVFESIGSGSGPKETFPGGFKYIDVCVFASGCSGGSINEGLQAGVSDLMTIALSGIFGTTPGVTLSIFPIKFQTSGDSYESGGLIRPGPNPISVVPVPAALPLLGAGLIALGAFARRRRSAAA